jgi:hypothetical protein
VFRSGVPVLDVKLVVTWFLDVVDFSVGHSRIGVEKGVLDTNIGLAFDATAWCVRRRLQNKNRH